MPSPPICILKIDQSLLKIEFDIIYVIFQSLEDNPLYANDFNTSPLYFGRTRGLFRECFVGEKINAPAPGKSK